jgi:hypothetical protein
VSLTPQYRQKQQQKLPLVSVQLVGWFDPEKDKEFKRRGPQYPEQQLGAPSHHQWVIPPEFSDLIIFLYTMGTSDLPTP